MPGQPAFRGASRRRAGSGVASGMALVVVLSMVAAIGATFLGGGASALAADASTYVPTLNNLPPGYREEAVDAVGGDLEPTIAMRRAFVSQDGNRRVVVDVSLGSSIQDCPHDAGRSDESAHPLPRLADHAERAVRRERVPRHRPGPGRPKQRDDRLPHLRRHRRDHRQQRDRRPGRPAPGQPGASGRAADLGRSRGRGVPTEPPRSTRPTAPGTRSRGGRPGVARTWRHGAARGRGDRQLQRLARGRRHRRPDEHRRARPAVELRRHACRPRRATWSTSPSRPRSS